VKLPPQKQAVLTALAAGTSAAKATKAAGVARTSLYRWLKTDPDFLAAYNVWQESTCAAARARLLAMVDPALNAVTKSIHDGNPELAYRLLRDLGLTRPPRSDGPIDPQQAVVEQALDLRGQAATLASRARDVEVQEILAGPLTDGSFSRDDAADIIRRAAARAGIAHRIPGFMPPENAQSPHEVQNYSENDDDDTDNTQDGDGFDDQDEANADASSAARSHASR
jgi:hypothetical protein